MADPRSIAAKELLKNFSMLGSFRESFTLVHYTSHGYDANSGVDVKTASNHTFTAVFVKSAGQNFLAAYRIFNIKDLPFKTGVGTIIAPYTDVPVVPSNNDLIVKDKDNVAYRIAGVSNLYEIAYLLHVELLIEPT
jgi:hypothetical protein